MTSVWGCNVPVPGRALGGSVLVLLAPESPSVSAEVTPQPLRVAVPGGAGLSQQCHLSPELPHRTQIPSCSPLAGHSSSWAPSKGNPSLSRDPATTVTSGNAAEAEGGRGSLQSLG